MGRRLSITGLILPWRYHGGQLGKRSGGSWAGSRRCKPRPEDADDGSRPSSSGHGIHGSAGMLPSRAADRRGSAASRPGDRPGRPVRRGRCRPGRRRRRAGGLCRSVSLQRVAQVGARSRSRSSSSAPISRQQRALLGGGGRSDRYVAPIGLRDIWIRGAARRLRRRRERARSRRPSALLRSTERVVRWCRT